MESEVTMYERLINLNDKTRYHEIINKHIKKSWLLIEITDTKAVLEKGDKLLIITR